MTGSGEAKVSVIIGTYNRAEFLQKCIASIFKQTRSGVVVYVTDAGSTDGTIDYLASVGSKRIIPILKGTRVGQARALNEVIHSISTPYACWLSDDNVVVNRGLDVALEILQRDPAMGMVALKVKDLLGPFVDAPYIGGISPVGILNVNQGMLPTEVLKRAGGFSEQFADYGIDADLTAKVLLLGYKVAYTKVVAIHHYRQWATDKNSPEYQALKKKHERYRQFYAAKYQLLGQDDWLWAWKKKSWKHFQRLLTSVPQLCSESGMLRMNQRDWINIFNARYLSLFDVLKNFQAAHHLVQRFPRKRLPARLPPDPIELC
ncbi:MAG: glycosyltransferase [Verrucomicrobiota bacterium]|nr:glycosyltransferase [Verrucomicrobiota bacterium]